MRSEKNEQYLPCVNFRKIIKFFNVKKNNDDNASNNNTIAEKVYNNCDFI